jgi:hypothetical protein
LNKRVQDLAVGKGARVIGVSGLLAGLGAALVWRRRKSAAG